MFRSAERVVLLAVAHAALVAACSTAAPAATQATAGPQAVVVPGADDPVHDLRPRAVVLDGSPRGLRPRRVHLADRGGDLSGAGHRLRPAVTGLFDRSRPLSAGTPSPAGPITVRFPLDSAAVSEQARLRLLAFALRLPSGATVDVAGHADRTGTGPYNEDLSRRRASAVARQLAASGLEPRVFAYGERCPAGPLDRRPASSAEDRRVVVTASSATRAHRDGRRPCTGGSASTG